MFLREAPRSQTVPRFWGLCIYCVHLIFYDILSSLVSVSFPPCIASTFRTRILDWEELWQVEGCFGSLQLLWVLLPLGPGDLPRLCSRWLRFSSVFFSAWMYTPWWLCRGRSEGLLQGSPKASVSFRDPMLGRLSASLTVLRLWTSLWDLQRAGLCTLCFEQWRHSLLLPLLNTDWPRQFKYVDWWGCLPVGKRAFGC